MKSFLAVSLFLAFAAIVVAQPANFVYIDTLEDEQSPIVANNANQLVSNQISVSSGLFPSRDLIRRYDPLLSSGTQATCQTSVLDESWFLNSGQAGAGLGYLQYDSASDSGSDTVTPLANPIDLSTGYAFFLRGSSDLVDTELTIDVYSNGISQVSSRTVTLQKRGDSDPADVVFDITIPYTSFSGNAQFSAVTAFVLTSAGELAQDVTIDTIGILQAGVSGTIWVDCDCDGNKEANDAGVSGITVTATPNGNCANPNPVSGVTLEDGTYSIVGLGACQYTIEPSNPGATFCGNSQETRSTTLSTNNPSSSGQNFFYRAGGSFTNVPGTSSVACTVTAAPSQSATFTFDGTCGSQTVSGSSSRTAPTCEQDGQFSYTYANPTGGTPATSIITILTDEEDPSITAPNDRTLTCSQTNGVPSENNPNAISTNQYGTPAASDDCSGVNVNSIPPFNVYDTQCTLNTCTSTVTITRTYTAVDGCGNQDTDSQTVTVTGCGGSSFVCPLIDYSCDTNVDTNSLTPGTVVDTNSLTPGTVVDTNSRTPGTPGSPVDTVSVPPLPVSTDDYTPFSTFTTFDRFSPFTSDASGACDCDCDNNNNNNNNNNGSSGAESLVASFSLIFAVFFFLF